MLTVTHRRAQEDVFLYADQSAGYGFIVDLVAGLIFKPWSLGLLLQDARWNEIADPVEREIHPDLADPAQGGENLAAPKEEPVFGTPPSELCKQELWKLEENPLDLSAAIGGRMGIRHARVFQTLRLDAVLFR